MNAATQATMFSSAHNGGTDNWATPQELFDKLDRYFHFDLDVCASAENAKCDDYFDESMDGLSQCWDRHTAFCNPPYSKVAEWMQKAANEEDCAVIACLVPARTDTKWFQEAFRRASAIIFIKGRLKFGDQKNSAPFPSCIIVFGEPGYREQNGPQVMCWDWKKEEFPL